MYSKQGTLILFWTNKKKGMQQVAAHVASSRRVLLEDERFRPPNLHAADGQVYLRSLQRRVRRRALGHRPLDRKPGVVSQSYEK